jgi:glycosyltransferase involved in cell wall biosynthesis
MTKLTLLTACYNSAATVGDTLKSVNAQTYEDIEHIIIDGASKDNTVALCHEIGTRITKVISEPDKGIYDAYNKGLTHATGEIIGFINSDDY